MFGVLLACLSVALYFYLPCPLFLPSHIFDHSIPISFTNSFLFIKFKLPHTQPHHNPYTHRHTQTHMHSHTYTSTHIFTRYRTHSHTLIYIHIYSHIYTHSHLCTHTHTCAHICTTTQEETPPLALLSRLHVNRLSKIPVHRKARFQCVMEILGKGFRH